MHSEADSDERLCKFSKRGPFEEDIVGMGNKYELSIFI